MSVVVTFDHLIHPTIITGFYSLIIPLLDSCTKDVVLYLRFSRQPTMTFQFKTMTFQFKEMGKLDTDCLTLIFSELQTDKKSLYSCLLVNREWCNLVVPILWEGYSWNKFDKHSWSEKSKRKLFTTILSCLPSSSKQLLLDNDIKLFPTKPPLFNYISFCKFLNSKIVVGIVKMVKEFNSGKVYKGDLLEQELCKLFISQCKNIKELSWKDSCLEVPLSLPEAPAFFSKLYCLYVCTDVDNSNYSNNALCKLTQICNDLNKLIVSGFEGSTPELVSLVNAQKNLKCVVLILYEAVERSFEELGEALKKCNTIEDLDLCTVKPITPSFLTSLTNLKRLKIDTYWDNSNYEEFQRCLVTSEFPKLQHFSISTYSSCFKALVMLIENTKGNILQVDISFCDRGDRRYHRHVNRVNNIFDENVGKLIKAVANNCPKIELLSTYLYSKCFIDVRLLLLNCRNLSRLKFESYSYNKNSGDELLEILTEFSPKSLNSITIYGSWWYSSDVFERFFESFRKRNLLYFEIEPRDHKKNKKNICSKYIDEGVIKEVNAGRYIYSKNEQEYFKYFRY